MKYVPLHFPISPGRLSENPRRVFYYLYNFTFWGLLAVSLIPGGLRADAQPEVREINRGWSYHWGDLPGALTSRTTARPEKKDESGKPGSGSEWGHFELPGQPPERRGRNILLLRNHLPAGTWRDPTLYINGIEQIFDVYLDGNLIYSHVRRDSQGVGHFAGYRWHLIPLDTPFQGGRLDLRIYSSHRNIGVFDNIRLGARSQHLTHMIQTDMYRLLIAFILIFLGVFQLFIYFFLHVQKSFFPLSVFTLLGGVHLLARTSLKLYLLNDPILWLYIEYLSLFLIPVGVFAFLERVLETRGFFYLWFFHLFFAILTPLLSLSELFRIEYSLLSFQIVIVPLFISVFIYIVLLALRGNREAWLITLGVAPALFLGIWETIPGILGNPSADRYFDIALLLFISAMTYLLFRRFSALYDYRKLMENASDVTVILENSGRLRYISPSVERVIGYKPSSLMESGLLQMFPRREQPGLRNFVRNLNKNPGQSRVHEFHVRSRQGDLRSIESVGKKNENGGGIILNARDVTEKKEAELRAKDKENRLRLLGEISSDIIADVSVSALIQRVLGNMSFYFPDYRVAYSILDKRGLLNILQSVQPKFLSNMSGEILTLDPEGDYYNAMLERRPVIINNSEDMQFYPELKKLFSSLDSYSALHYSFTHSDHFIGILSFASIKPRSWKEHEIQTLRDVAEYLSIALKKSKVQEQYTRAEEQARLFYEIVLNMHIPIFVFRVKGFGENDEELIRPRLISANPAALKMSGRKIENLTGQYLEEIFPDLGRLTEKFSGVMSGILGKVGGLELGEMKLIRGEQTDFYAAQAFALSADCIGLAFYEITELKKSEVALESARETAEQASKAKSSFLANMSHEIRTPLNAIIGMADLLWETPLNAEQLEFVRLFRRAGDNLLVLVNDILDISKIETGHFVPENIPFALNDVLYNVYEIMSIRANEKKLKMLIEMGPDVPERVMGDPHRLNQILMNLIGNAVKFTKSGHIRLEVELAGMFEKERTSATQAPGKFYSLKFSVRDTGPGIGADKLKLIFDSFAQADSSTTRKFGGSGLGLAICRNLIEKMGGRIWANSRLSEGSEFSFILPFEGASDSLEEKAENLNTDLDSAPFIEPTHQRPAPVRISPANEVPRILLVEDTEDNRLLVGLFLKGYNIKLDMAENGQIAVDMFKQSPYDLVLMDLQMPVMDGYTATGLMREYERLTGERHAARTEIPILALSAFAHSVEVQKCLEAGCSTHMAKPIKKETLIAGIRRFLDIHEST